MEPVRLVGPRVLVRSVDAGDAARYVRYQNRNRGHLGRWEPEHDPEFYTETYWTARIGRYEEERTRDAGLRMGVFDPNDDTEFAGLISLMDIHLREPVWNARVGYSLDASKEGHGWMSEALGLVIRHCFETLNLKRLLAGHMPHNARSASVLERAGFVREGYYRDFFFIDGAWHDHVDTSLLNPHWQPPTSQT